MTHCNNLNTKIEEALANSDIQKIMSKACRTFTNQLDGDEIYTCKLNALWKSFKNFKPEKNTKFTTYLYQGVYIECLKEIKFKNKSKKSRAKLHENIPSKDSNILMVDILDEAADDEELSLIKNKIENMTINEMAESRSYSRETVRKKIKKISERIKHKFK